MLRGWWFAMAFTLCGTLGCAPAHATANVIKSISAVGNSGLFRAVINSARGGILIKNGKVVLKTPFKTTLPFGVDYERSEIDAGKWITRAFGGGLAVILPRSIICSFQNCDNADKTKS